MKENSILNYYNSINADFLHANGESGTEYLIQQLDLRGKERVLEIGFGTGATLVKLKNRYPHLQLTGIEANPKMIQKTRRRINFCQLKNQIELLHIEDRDQIPDQSIDLVYVESVLAILEQENLYQTINYIHRVLTPNGRLAINESIWLETTSKEEISAINQQCKEKFGIIQCNEELASEAVAKALFKKQGFKNTFFNRIHNEAPFQIKRKHYRESLSKLFTYIGKSRLLFKSDLKRKDQQYKAEMNNIFKQKKQYLSGAIMIFQKETD